MLDPGGGLARKSGRPARYTCDSGVEVMNDRLSSAVQVPLFNG